MAIVSGTTTTYSLIGAREDLQDMIYELAPMETPFMTMAARGKAKGRFVEWQADSLAASAANAHVEGDEAAFTTATQTTRLGNYCQISKKTMIVSGTADAVDKAGRKRELARQIVKYGKELKRDMEKALVTNQASTAGSVASARLSAGAESWISGNRILSAATDTTGTTPGFASGTVAAPTDGTQATLTETVFLSALQAAWTDGGDPSVVIVGPYNKNKINGFTGIATKYNQVGKNTANNAIIASADVYVSDYGEHKIVLDRHSRDRTVLCLDPDFWEIGYLRPMMREPLAKTGDAEKYQLLVEYTLVARNPDSSAKVQDCQTA